MSVMEGFGRGDLDGIHGGDVIGATGPEPGPDPAMNRTRAKVAA